MSVRVWRRAARKLMVSIHEYPDLVKDGSGAEH